MVGKGRGLVVVISLLQLDDGVHQRFGNVLSAVHAETSVQIRNFQPSLRAAATNAAILTSSLTPSVSMPELTSTP